MSRSKRHNIRITEIPAGAQGSRPRSYIAGLLQDVLSPDEKPFIEQVHRTWPWCTSQTLHPEASLLSCAEGHFAESHGSTKGFKSFRFTLLQWQSKGHYSTVPGSFCETSPASGMAYFTPQNSWVPITAQTSFTDHKKAEEYMPNDSPLQGRQHWGRTSMMFNIWEPEFLFFKYSKCLVQSLRGENF